MCMYIYIYILIYIHISIYIYIYVYVYRLAAALWKEPFAGAFWENHKTRWKTMVSESPSLPDLGRHTFLRRPDCYASVWRCKRWIRAHRGSGSGNQFQRGPKMSKVNPKCQKLWLDWLVTVSHLSPCQFGFGMSCGMKFVTVSLWEFFSSSHFWQKGSERNLWMPSQFPVLHCADLQRFSQDAAVLLEKH